MKPREEATETVVQTLRKKKILTVKEICEIADWSAMTVWRNLTRIGYYTSFNYNARYYTLAETPRFDEKGLWFYRTAGFSSYRTLIRTIVALVENSPMGMTPNELSSILTVRVQNQLTHLYRKNEIGRVKWGRAQLYLSCHEKVRAEQLHRRETPGEGLLLAEHGERFPTEDETIEILAQLVRTPRFPARGIAIVLSARGLKIKREKVLAVIEKYGLQKKGRLRRSRH